MKTPHHNLNIKSKAERSQIESKPFFSKSERVRHFGSLGYLNLTQFLGGMNDNIIKFFIVFCFIEIEGIGASNSILSSVGAIYVLPFLLFSHFAGMLADRYSKRSLIIWIKNIEIATMLLAFVAFSIPSKLLAFFALFLLSSHSAFFGPCKYSIVPEIVPQEKISQANGLITSCTYAAIIVGTFLASFLVDLTGRRYTVAVLFCLIFAIVGQISSLFIQKTPPAFKERKLSFFLFRDILKTMRIIRRGPSLLAAVLSSSYFLFVGSFVQLNIIPYGMQHLGLSDTQGGYLFLLTALGIGAGSLLAGTFSGKAVELGLSPIGGVGMIFCCFLLDHCATHLYVVIPLLLIVGVCGGFYLVPIDSYIQVTSPKAHRGQILAMLNFLGFIGVLLSVVAFYVVGGILGLPPRRVFSFLAILTTGVLFLFTLSISGYIVRFQSFLVSRILFRIELKKKELIPLYHPSYFIVPLSFWPWAMVLLSSQRRRMVLFSCNAQETLSFWMKILKKLLPITEVNEPSSLLPSGQYGPEIEEAITEGSSVVLFCSKADFSSSYQKLVQEWKALFEKKIATAVPFFALVKPPTQEKNGHFHRSFLQAEVTRVG